MQPRGEGKDRDAADLSIRLRGLNQLADSPRASLPYFAAKKRRILLIHGYNVTEKSAAAAMYQLRENVSRQAEPLGSACFTVTWPGNRAVYLGGPAAYPWLKDIAVKTGAMLHRHLVREYEEGFGAEELVIVAHSLGCRVALELASRLTRCDRPAGLRRVILFLMAAAVPTELDDLIGKASNNSDAVFVLHSLADWVLWSWFRLGQTAALEGMMPEAVGRRGNPDSPKWTDQRAMVGYGHGDYWPGDGTADFICEKLREHLSDVVLRRDPDRMHTLPARDLDSRDLLMAHQLNRFWL